MQMIITIIGKNVNAFELSCYTAEYKQNCINLQVITHKFTEICRWVEKNSFWWYIESKLIVFGGDDYQYGEA